MSVEQNTDLIPLGVHGVLIDRKTDTQIVILRDQINAHVLPIWVGKTEGDSIRLALDNGVPARPTSHDLITSLVTHLGVTISHVVVTEVQNNTYYATIHLSANGLERTIDARPSDAIALALRVKCPMYVVQDVLNKRNGDGEEAWLTRFDQKEFDEPDA